MDKIPIYVPDGWKPDATIALGYSGGMALYVADEQSFMYLFEYTNVAYLAYITITISKLIN